MLAHSSTSRVTHALTDPIPDAKPSLRLYTQAMNALVGVDRNCGHRSVFFVKPDDQCFDRVLGDARKDRLLKLAKEIIPAAIAAYDKVRRKANGPLRPKKQRDSMPLVVESQLKFAKSYLKSQGYVGVHDIAMAHNGTALNFLHETPSGTPKGTQGGREDCLAMVATPEGLHLVLESGSGQTVATTVTPATLRDPKFIQRLAYQIAPSIRALMVFVDPKLKGIPAEALRQVYRQVRRRVAENAIAFKRVGAVDRSTPLCLSCHRLVRHVGDECACGATHSQGILDAHSILAAGRDSMGAVAYLCQGGPHSFDVPTGGASVSTTADIEDVNAATEVTGEPSRSLNTGLCQGRKPLNDAVINQAGRDAHREDQHPAQEPVGQCPPNAGGHSRPVAEPSDPTMQSVETQTRGFVGASSASNLVPQKTSSDSLAGATSSQHPGQHEPNHDSPAEAHIEHPMLQPWWKRLGMKTPPTEEFLVEDMHQLAKIRLPDEVDYYFRTETLFGLPVEWGLRRAPDNFHTRQVLLDHLVQEIYPLIEAYNDDLVIGIIDGSSQPPEEALELVISNYAGERPEDSEPVSSLQTLDVQACRSAESKSAHPRLLSWWQRLGLEARPTKCLLAEMKPLASFHATQEAEAYFSSRTMTLLPRRWKVADGGYKETVLEGMTLLLYKDILAKMSKSGRVVKAADGQDDGRSTPSSSAPIHPMAQSWWERLGSDTKPSVMPDIHQMKVRMMTCADREASHYITNNLLHLLPDYWLDDLSLDWSESVSSLTKLLAGDLEGQIEDDAKPS